MEEETKDPFIGDADDAEIDTTDAGGVAVDDEDDTDDLMWDEE